MSLLLNSTPIALWHDIILEAEARCEISLCDELESYLVFLLTRYLNKPEIVQHIMATELLQSATMTTSQRLLALQAVGDKCLLFSGLFPNIADARLVKLSYFVCMGQTAYESISNKQNDLYHLLAQEFVTLMDILQAIRCYSEKNPDLLPLQAYELWSETGSQRALQVLKQFTKGIPIRVNK